MLIYLLTFYLFDDIEKNIKITHANHSATSKAILTKMLVVFTISQSNDAKDARGGAWYS